MNHRTIHRFLIAAAAFALPAQSIAQGKWIHASTASQLAEIHRASNKVVGLSVAVAKDGKILYAQGFGHKNREKDIKASDITRYRLASVSKPISSLLACELIMKDKLYLDFKVSRYLKSLPSGHNYSTRQILGHMSGIRHYKDDDKTSNVDEHYTRMSDACKLFIKDKLLFDPGDKYDYSTHAYSVLGWLIEHITGKFFWQYANERFNAWGLTDLRTENSVSQGVNRSQIYKIDDGKAKVAGRDDISWKYPGGGMECSARDMANLGIKVLEGKIIPRYYLDSVVWKSQKAGGKDTGFGLGWDVGSRDGKRVVAHSGAQTGASSFWRLYPDHGVVVVVLSNTRHDGVVQLSRDLADLAFGKNVPVGKPIN